MVIFNHYYMLSFPLLVENKNKNKKPSQNFHAYRPLMEIVASSAWK